MILFFGLVFFTLLWIGIAKLVYRTKITTRECAGQFGITTLVIIVTILIGDWQSTSDTELYHGEITGKERTQNYFQTSYDCNCRCTARDKNGTCNSESCDTCYTDHYTVDWSLQTTLGPYRIDYVDRSSRSAWLLPDPASYASAYASQPFSKDNSYTNYFLLYKESLFNNNPNLQTYAKELENSTYPCVTGYDVNLVYSSGLRNIDALRYNDLIRQYLRGAGAAKQVNIILYFTSVQDQAFRYALESKWNGGKKNDVIIIIAVNPSSDVSAPVKPTWVDVISMGKNIGNEMLQVSLREDLMLADINSPIKTTEIITANIDKYFHRKPMSSFKYIEEARQVPIGVTLVAILVTLMLNVGFTIYSIRRNLFS